MVKPLPRFVLIWDDFPITRTRQTNVFTRATLFSTGISRPCHIFEVPVGATSVKVQKKAADRNLLSKGLYTRIRIPSTRLIPPSTRLTTPSTRLTALSTRPTTPSTREITYYTRVKRGKCLSSAVQDKNGKYIFRVPSWNAATTAAGTDVYLYHGANVFQDRIYIPGPTTEPLHIVVS